LVRHRDGWSADGGGLALLDAHGGRGDATPLHVHRDEAEIFYLIDGQITAWAGEEQHELAEGSAVYLPPGLPHAFRVDSETARIITVTAPGKFADLIRAVSIETDEVPAHWDFDLNRMIATAPQYGIEIVGPPPS
jgi:mannose-6-phosphate isomerase-like protein (cupin superfamily)